MSKYVASLLREARSLIKDFDHWAAEEAVIDSNKGIYCALTAAWAIEERLDQDETVVNPLYRALHALYPNIAMGVPDFNDHAGSAFGVAPYEPHARHQAVLALYDKAIEMEEATDAVAE